MPIKTFEKYFKQDFLWICNPFILKSIPDSFRNDDKESFIDLPMEG